MAFSWGGVSPAACLRDLSNMRNELARASQAAQASCVGLSSTLHRRQDSAALALERDASLREQLELQLRERLAEFTGLQTRTEQLTVRSERRGGGVTTGREDLVTLSSADRSDEH